MSNSLRRMKYGNCMPGSGDARAPLLGDVKSSSCQAECTECAVVAVGGRLLSCKGGIPLPRNESTPIPPPLSPSCRILQRERDSNELNERIMKNRGIRGICKGDWKSIFEMDVNTYIYGGARRGRGKTRNRNNCCRKWCYFPELC